MRIPLSIDHADRLIRELEDKLYPGQGHDGIDVTICEEQAEGIRDEIKRIRQWQSAARLPRQK